MVCIRRDIGALIVIWALIRQCLDERAVGHELVEGISMSPSQPIHEQFLVMGKSHKSVNGMVNDLIFSMSRE